MKFLEPAFYRSPCSWQRAPPVRRPSQPVDNPAIDMQGFLRVSSEAASARASRRISEGDFIRMSREPGTIVLDARAAKNSTNCTSRERFT